MAAGLPAAPETHLDTILTLQIAVARLGEKPMRFWWNSDIADADGGADLLQRLVGVEMAPLSVMEGLLLSAARTEERLLAHIPAPPAYSLFCPEPELRIALRRRFRHFKRYPDEFPDAISTLVDDGMPPDGKTAEDLFGVVESVAQGAAVPVSEEQTSFGTELKLDAAAGVVTSWEDRAITLAAALARVAIRSPRGEYTLPYYREAPRG
ncbi:MAG: BREX-6 system BrxE protein [Alkalispirochaeta sp.]